MTRSALPLLQPRQLQAIAAVARAGSVHAGARALGIPQPALSRLLSTAERLLGTALFERSRSGSTPTEAGVRVIRHATFVLQALEGLSDVARHALPVVRLGCIPRAMEALVPHLLAQLSPDAAGFRLQISVGTSNELVSELRASHLDFAIARGAAAPGEGATIVAKRLYNEGTVVACGVHNRDVPRSTCPIAKLAGCRWILPKRGYSSRDTLDSLLSALGLPPLVPVIESNSFESNLAVVATTPFLTIAPQFAAQRAAELGLVTILRTRPAFGTSPVMLQYQHGQEAHPAFSAFQAAVTKAARLAAAR